MVYATLADIRTETGNLPTDEVPDALLLLKQKAAYSHIQLGVKRTLLDPFISTDIEFYKAVEIESKFTAAWAMKMYGSGYKEEAEKLEAEAEKEMAFLMANVQEASDTGDVNILLAVTPYLSIGAAQDENPSQTTITPYRSGLTDSV
jgi:hypothetical protein